MHSFMAVRNGHVVAEGWWKPEAAEKPHVMHSLSKSFTSTAVGLAIAEGKLSVDDPVLKFFPEDAPAEPSDKLKAMRVRDLLTMSTGHETEAKFTDETLWVKTFLAHPVPHKPGAHFLYNTPGSYMLSAIVQKVTGQTVLDYLRPRLFEPLCIENPEINVVWDNLLSAMQPAPLPANTAEEGKLKQTLASLAARPPAAKKSADAAPARASQVHENLSFKARFCFSQIRCRTTIKVLNHYAHDAGHVGYLQPLLALRRSRIARET